MRWFVTISIVLAAVLAASTNCTAETVLYDGNALMGLPDWLYGTDGPVAPSYDSVSSPARTVLDTTGDFSVRAGFWYQNMPELNPSTGFTVSFDVQVTDENHDTNNDRAGFSVILLGSDPQGIGIEIAFWEDKIWAQNIDFTPGEEIAFNTTSMTSYELEISDLSYSLRVDGGPELTGSVRDYPTSRNIIYGMSNVLWLGDDTSRAEGDFGIAYVTLVPEPSTLVLLSLAAVGLPVWWWRRRRSLGRG